MDNTTTEPSRPLPDAPARLTDPSAALLDDVEARLDGRTVAVAESCTGGALASRLVAFPGSGQWFRGGVVAYHSEVKISVLGVRPGPVVAADAATEMAAGVCRLLGADVGLATTGVAGPEPQDGQPVGTVWIAAVVDGRPLAPRLHRLSGEPEDIRAAAVEAAIAELDAVLRQFERAV